MSQTKVATSQINLLAFTTARDIGLVANDNTKRVENTAAIQAFWAAGGANLEFNSQYFTNGTTSTIYYFESWTLPGTMTCTQAAGGQIRPDNIIILDFAPTGTVAIEVGVNAQRHSAIRGFSIKTTSSNKTGIKIQNGGMHLSDLQFNAFFNAIHITQSYGASYERITVIGASAGSGLLLDLTSNGVISVNNFTAIAVSYCEFGIKADNTGITGIFAGNTFTSSNLENSVTAAIRIIGDSYVNQFTGIWTEWLGANSARDIHYSNGTNNSDCFQSFYRGTSAAGVADILADRTTLISTGTTTPFLFVQNATASLPPNFNTNVRSFVGGNGGFSPTAVVSDKNESLNVRYSMSWNQSGSSLGSAVDIATINNITGIDAGYKTTIYVRTFETTLAGSQFCISEGVATSVGNTASNSITLAMTVLRQDTLGPGTLAWTNATGLSSLRYTPTGESTLIEVQIVQRKFDFITPG